MIPPPFSIVGGRGHTSMKLGRSTTGRAVISAPPFSLAARNGEQVRTARLDVVDEDAAHAAARVAMDSFGHLDVVANNAGYGDIAPFEQLSSERFRALIDTNFYGVVNVTRAAIPVMRKQKCGCVLQISCVGGRLARPGAPVTMPPNGQLEDSPSLLPWR
jgi:NAD(P)-dependent dehydrogenase (short-subunit alcohol dehydrogenase family)